MLFSSLVAAAAVAATASAKPINIPHSVHEKRNVLPRGWERVNELHPTFVLPMRIGMTQSNIDKSWQWLQEISDPTSPTYGQHWNAKQVAEAFAPAKQTVDAIKSWLTDAGIAADRFRQSQSLGFIEFNATIAEAEELLQTKYHVYEHETGQPHVACEEYSIPSHLRDHVDFVYPTVHFDAKLRAEGYNGGHKKRAASSPPDLRLGQPGSSSLPKLGSILGSKNNIIQELTQCDKQIVPDCLRLLYEFLPNFDTAAENSYGIVEYTPQAYVPSDLDQFFRNFSTKQVGNRPILDSIDGGVVQQTNKGFGYNGESDLDLEYAMTLVYPQDVTLYQVGDLQEGASFNNFLDAIDASYCTYEGGNNNNYDGQYPDPLPGGYQGPNNCGGFAATKVISTSYSYNEADLTPAYEQRQCNEYAKLGLQGVTVLYSSGDNGVAGNGDECIGPNGAYIPSSRGGRFNPSFPGTCPYITSVGATQVKPNTSVPAAIVSGTQPEMACETIIYSGGGFSDVFPIPSYQKTAQAHYFQNYKPSYTSAQYNNSQQVRGLPDISANGANYVIAVDGQFALVFGTSASSPTLGSIITLINQARLKQGKSTVGFINPVAYAHPEVFNDITEGNNPGCNTEGFSAVPGWDPVTGLGTPNFPKMLKLWLNLA